jgi:transcription antitermination factor NusG
MPILCQEPSLYPADLLESVAHQSSERRWWALYTKSRQEKSVARHLLGLEIPYYLPMVRKTLAYPGRRVTSYVPLFTGYVFMYGSPEERIVSLSSNRVPQALAVPDTSGFTGELSRIDQLIQSGVDLAVESRPAPGQRVRIRCGALSGLEGTVLKRHGETRLVVSVDFIQQGASIQIEDCLLETV